MRFLGISVADAVPDANTIWTFREGLKRAGAVDVLFRRFDELLRAYGFLALSGQIVDATIVAAPKQRNTQEEKQALRDGRIPKTGRRSPRSSLRRTATRAGPSNTRKPSRRRMACRRSISPSLPLAIRTKSRSTVRM